jgi:hypothetical protein
MTGMQSVARVRSRHRHYLDRVIGSGAIIAGCVPSFVEGGRREHERRRYFYRDQFDALVEVQTALRNMSEGDPDENLDGMVALLDDAVQLLILTLPVTW